ncbi:hypothetical protein M433DRAFT_142527 [Acidomyces richmondensis BFW]|nr:MAG: hypothetical protein FE78DRAFT_78225 [Acidomyces sp. 'richmondensis']KYG46876.1 hypothetical protein M433DRAFT_142527 [Acidomyces richmondensis BFW]
MDHAEELHTELDEPPDEASRRGPLAWSPPKFDPTQTKAIPPQNTHRRESLLTRQLHSEPEQSDDDAQPRPPPRAMSTQSTWSNQSTTSTAELTSDDGRSVPSPAISPPLPPTHIQHAVAMHEKGVDRKIQIIEPDGSAAPEQERSAEKAVEATLGRKRCIMFACRGKDEQTPKGPLPSQEPEKTSTPTSPPKRKCTITFACPTRAGSDAKPAEMRHPKRHASPPPPTRKASGGLRPEVKSHRGSDSTVTHASPKNDRKGLNVTAIASIPTPSPPAKISRTSTNDSDDSAREAFRFHEFASSEDEPEEWVQESTCHRKRLTISDTLEKENVIRKACEEVEEEAVEEDEADEEAAEAELIDEDGDDEDEAVFGPHGEDESDSDAGFHSDDEEGFAASDSDGEGSDYEWWKPGGSTAATSVEHLDRMIISAKPETAILGSSLGSISSGHMSPHSSHHTRHPGARMARPRGIPINRPEESELPDSTDFVCGTLDEDRPLEQAYINRMKQIAAAKHKVRPQDIDPSFPTSDPEMDEEDEEDLDDHEDSDDERFVHGDMDDFDTGESTWRQRSTGRPRTRSNLHRSPPPPARYHSPPPTKRVLKHHSPPPPAKRGTARSPAPAARYHSPPPPRKLFGHSPIRRSSPAPVNMTSPPNTRRPSPSRGASFASQSHGLAERPQLTHTASLPRGGPTFLLSALGRNNRFDDDEESDTVGAANTDVIPKRRGAIDIVKGLEKKRQRRKEKMWQKMCAKAAAKGEKTYKVKPGKGAERMREVGLELQKYHGKAEHILSL